MRRLKLKEIYQHPEINKYLLRSGVDHAINVAQYAFDYSLNHNIDFDLATKAGLLHDIGHYTWYTNGKWDYQMYKQNDIHAIKGAARAHEYLVELGESPDRAKEISLAILLHTDSYLPSKLIYRTPLQEVIRLADEADEEPRGKHHYRKISSELAIHKLTILDHQVDVQLNNHRGLA